MFNIEKIIEQIKEAITPALKEGKEQAKQNTLIQAATQIYCAHIMRGSNPNVKGCIAQAKEIIDDCR